MIIIMRPGAQDEQVAAVVDRIEEMGLQAHRSDGAERSIIGVVGDDRYAAQDALGSMTGVERVVPVSAPYKLAARDSNPSDTVIPLLNSSLGGREIPVIAGPCSVESRTQTMEIAEQLAAMGCVALRGGAFKPRTSPYSFQGLGVEALEIMAEAREKYGLAIVTEVMTAEEVPMVAEYVDVLQIGTRNMQNYRLLEACGKSDTAVLLKRGMSATIEELLLAAEYVLAGGNPNVAVCERGIRTYEPATRSTCDINAVPLLKLLTHLPVVLDPSHATGRADLVAPVSMAGVAAGADGLIVEVHGNPEKAFSDGDQSLRPADFQKMLDQLERVAGAVDRTLARQTVSK